MGIILSEFGVLRVAGCGLGEYFVWRSGMGIGDREREGEGSFLWASSKWGIFGLSESRLFIL